MMKNEKNDIPSHGMTLGKTFLTGQAAPSKIAVMDLGVLAGLDPISPYWMSVGVSVYPASRGGYGLRN